MIDIYPSLPDITNGKRHNVTIARKAPSVPGSIVSMDCGYNDYGDPQFLLYCLWTQNTVVFGYQAEF